MLDFLPLDLPVCVQRSGYSPFRCVPSAWHSPAPGRISAQGLRAVTSPAPPASMGSSSFVTPIPSRCSQGDLAEHSSVTSPESQLTAG